MIWQLQPKRLLDTLIHITDTFSDGGAQGHPSPLQLKEPKSWRNTNCAAKLCTHSCYLSSKTNLKYQPPLVLLEELSPLTSAPLNYSDLNIWNSLYPKTMFMNTNLLPPVFTCEIIVNVSPLLQSCVVIDNLSGLSACWCLMVSEIKLNINK